MRKHLCFSRAALLTALLLKALSGLGQSHGADPETRVLEYIRDHLHPGEPLIVTELYNKVFTQPEERKALNKLYNAFFRIPLFVAQFQERFGAPPTLKVIAEQFDLENPEAADVLVKVMESDPRVPRFFTRDAKTGEIARVDRQKILSDPRFAKAIERQLSGWEGKPAPQIELPGLDGRTVSTSGLGGKVALLYIWFTGCPPCMEETPALVALGGEFARRGLTIVGANADRLLGLGYDDGVRRRYAEEQKIDFPLVHWTRESDAAFGNITIFPTLFLIDGSGVIVRHWIGFVSREELRTAILKALQAPKAAP